MSGTSNVIVVNVPLFIILGLVAGLIMVSNLFTIIVISRSRCLRNVTGYLMISLACADFGVGIMTLVPLVFAIFTQHMSEVVCAALGFLSSSSWVVSIFTLTLLSLDRFLAIIKPLHYETLVTNIRCGIAIVVTWIASFILWFLPLVGVGGYKFNDEEAACYFDVSHHPIQWLVYMIVIFLPTSVIIIYCYITIWKVSLYHRQHMEASMTKETIPNNRKNFKAIRTLAIIVGAFYVAWLPFTVEHIVKAFKGSLEEVPEWLEIAIFVLAIANSFWNPIIYISSNKIFRRATFKLFGRMCNRNKVHVGPINLVNTTSSIETNQ